MPKSRKTAAYVRDAAPSADQQQHLLQVRSVLFTLGLGLTGSLLLWAAFPPLNLSWLAWIAPLSWLWLIRSPKSISRQGYGVLWLAGCVHWLLMLEGIRLAHPALYAGWIALAAYLGVYLPAFIGLTRVAVHRLRVSLVLAAPATWVGLELIRGHLITGFSMGLLAHTQAEFPLLIQISDLAGGYTLSFLIMLVAACLTQTAWAWLGNQASQSRGSVLHSKTRLVQLLILCRPMAIAAAAILATLLYGRWRLGETPPGSSSQPAHIALIQGSLDTIFEASPERIRETFDHYNQLTDTAVAQQPNLDLVVWPESMFAVPDVLAEESLSEDLRRRLKPSQDDFHVLVANEAARANANTAAPHPGTLLLAGTTTYVYGSSTARVYNSALLADRDGSISGRYNKTHPVMFGEYIPFGAAFPWLYKLTPMSGGLSVGDGPKIFEVAGLRFSPSICFESTIPHLIRGQVLKLQRRGMPVDVLVNVTNDGWFWGTGMLDLHFRCGVFRAVENRKPMLVVANTGISMFADANGLVRQRGPKRQPQVLIAEVRPDGRWSPYQAIGDWPAAVFAAATLGLALVGLKRSRAA